MLVEKSKRDAIEKIWEDYWIAKHTSTATEALKEYFLDDSLSVPIVKTIHHYAEQEIVQEMIDISPKRVLDYLFEDENFKLRKERFSDISLYI